eukprot:c2888_g1_i1 orf=876-2162(+)
MECNKEEALRSLRLAEQKFLQLDLIGAKKFALKAQYLFPDLEGLPQLMSMLDVHIVAQQKVDGVEVNWYRILQTDATADEATIRKQYRKLALILHPDKNKAIGAEGAFKLISEAWRVLSDKEKKAAHDAKRMVNRNVSPGFPSMKPTKRFCNFTHFNAWCQPRPGDKKNSFWTGCPSCKMQFEYMRVHENKKISCPTCHKFFMATEIQATGHTSDSQSSVQSSRKAGSSCSEMQFQTDKGRPVHVGSSFSFRWGNVAAAKLTAAAAAKSTAEMVHQTYEAVKRERVKAQKEAREKEAMERMEARRREHRKRKQKQIQVQMERLANVTAHANEKVSGMEPMDSNDLDSGRADAVNLKLTEGVENGIGHMGPLDAINGQKEFGARIGERVAKLDQVQEPLRCNVSNTFDSTNSHESRDVFSFSKRLKVDV